MIVLDDNSYVLLTRFVEFYLKYLNDIEYNDFDKKIIDILEEYDYLIENESEE